MKTKFALLLLIWATAIAPAHAEIIYSFVSFGGSAKSD